MWETIGFLGILAATALVVKHVADILDGSRKIYVFVKDIIIFILGKSKVVIRAESLPRSSYVGQRVSLSIIVSSEKGTPSGTVSIYEGAVEPANLIVGPLALNGSGKLIDSAVIPVSHLRIGTHCYTVAYSG